MFFSAQIIQTMASPNALLQMRAASQMMDIMDAFDEEEERYRERKRRSTWVKQWLTIRENPRYRIITMWHLCDGKVTLIKKYYFDPLYTASLYHMRNSRSRITQNSRAVFA